MVHGKREPVGHDAHDRVNRAPQPKVATDGTRIRGEASTPHVEADHDDRSCPGSGVTLHEGPPDQGRNASQTEAGGSDFGYIQRLDGAIFDDQIAGDRPERGHVLDRFHLRSPEDEVVKRPPFLPVRPPIPVLESNQAVPFTQRDRGIEARKEDGEEADADRDADRDSQTADQGEAGVPRASGPPA